ncbi:MAG: 8-oxo-dGTP diphosphatase [Lachnospiraceae bacterium]|nr:8-oxo-dGTP diphosphatase [Lachnospiraceae bacterium]
MQRTEVVEFTNMCMVYDGDRVLVQNRVKKWKGIAFPGGHVENGESFTDAVIREVFEETGLTISNPKPCGIKSWRKDDGTRYVVLFYKTDKFTGTLRSSEEGEMYWVELKDMPKLNLADGMEENLKVFLDEELNELFWYKENDEWKYVLK